MQTITNDMLQSALDSINEVNTRLNSIRDMIKQAMQPAVIKKKMAEIGINMSGMKAYARGVIPVDLMRIAEMRLDNWNYVVDPSITLLPGATDAMASAVGFDDGGWPTKAPPGRRVMMTFDLGAKGFSKEYEGTYKMRFPAGTGFRFEGGRSMVMTNYDMAKGTADLKVTAGITGEAAPRIILESYNGVQNTFAPFTPDRAFTIIKDGEDPKTFLTKNSLASLKGLTSAAIGVTERRGILRAMEPCDINRGGANKVWNMTRKQPHQNRLGTTSGSGQFTVIDLVTIADAINSHLWVNLPDTNSVAANLEIAVTLDKIVKPDMVCVIENSNESVFNFGGSFVQTSDAFARSKTNFGPNGDLLKQYNLDMREKLVAPFESVFKFEDPRYFPVAGIQAAQANYGIIARILDGGELYKHVKGICGAPYVGGGIASFHLGDYKEQSIFKKASRDKAGIDDIGFLDDLFAAQKIGSDLVLQKTVKVFETDLDRYQVDRGLAPDSIVTCSYEFNWQHYNMTDTNKVSFKGSITGRKGTIDSTINGPVRANDVLTGTGVIAGTKVLSVDGNTFTVDRDYPLPTGPITITSSTNLYAQAVGRLLAQALRDPRAGAAQVDQIKWFQRPGFHCLFSHIGAIDTLYNAGSGSNWGMQDALGNEKTDYPYRAVADHLRLAA